MLGSNANILLAVLLQTLLCAMQFDAMDAVERRRIQNRMAQRRYRSKKASESSRKTPSNTAPSTANDATTPGGTVFIPYSAANANAKIHRNPAPTTLPYEPNVASTSAEAPRLPDSTDLWSSVSANVQDMLLPDSRDGFSALNSALTGVVPQETDQTMSSSLRTRSSITQAASQIQPDDFSCIPSTLTDKLRHPLQLQSPNTEMHTDLILTSTPGRAFHSQPAGPDPGLNFSVTADQLTPSSLHDSSETGSSSLSAASYQIEFCQGCPTLAVQSPPHVSLRSIISNRGHDGNKTDDNVDEDFESSLHIAAESGHSDLVDMLLRSGSVVNESDSEGNTPLHRATTRQRLPVIQRLLCHGADPNVMNAAGRTPVHIAVSTGSMEIVETLVHFGGDLNRRAKRKNSRIDSNHVESNDT